MKFLGRLRGSGSLLRRDETIGPAEYDLDGYTVRPGEVVASGELQRSLGRRDVRLPSSDGLVFHLRLGGEHSELHVDADHIDVTDNLPPATAWRH